MRFLSIVIVFVVLCGCKKKEQPKPPESAQLVFPDQNSECTTGKDIGATTSEVEFRWQAANNTETYQLRATNLNSNTTQTINTSATTAILPLDKGAPYSWTVTSKNTAVIETTESSLWRFYNSGSETTFAPFPAEILAPRMGATVAKDINNETLLRWAGADVDNNFSSFEIYFSTNSSPETLVKTVGANTSELKVTTTSDTIYYWKVITIDTDGNTSDSGVFEFRVG